MENNINTIYKTQWRAYFKRGLSSPEIVYGESEDEAKCNALAYIRNINRSIWNWTIDDVVQRVDIIG